MVFSRNEVKMENVCIDKCIMDVIIVIMAHFKDMFKYKITYISNYYILYFYNSLLTNFKINFNIYIYIC